MQQHVPGRRRLLRVLFVGATLAVAVHILLPQVGEVGDAIRALRTGRWRFLLLALAGAVGTYLAGAWTVGASVRIPLRYARTLLSQVAGSLLAVITPAGVGWIAVTDSYLSKSGADESTAHAATTLVMAITFISHIGLLILLLPLLPTLSLPDVTLPDTQVLIEGAVAVLVVLGVLFWIPASRRRILTEMTAAARAVPGVLGDPRRSLTMVAASIAANLSFGLALIGSIAAFGPAPSPIGVLVAYMFAATVAAVSPTPGGLGAMEAALVAALTRIGVVPGPAVAAALTFRLVTFWLPLPFGAWALRRGRTGGWL